MQALMHMFLGGKMCSALRDKVHTKCSEHESNPRGEPRARPSSGQGRGPCNYPLHYSTAVTPRHHSDGPDASHGWSTHQEEARGAGPAAKQAEKLLVMPAFPLTLLARVLAALPIQLLANAPGSQQVAVQALGPLPPMYACPAPGFGVAQLC